MLDDKRLTMQLAIAEMRSIPFGALAKAQARIDRVHANGASSSSDKTEGGAANLASDSDAEASASLLEEDDEEDEWEAEREAKRAQVRSQLRAIKAGAGVSEAGKEPREHEEERIKREIASRTNKHA